MRRFLLLLLTAMTLAGFAGCHKKKVTNPLADVGSKQPDKVLFDRAMDAMKKNKWDTARLLLQALINTYPDSEYIARAKLAVGDSWYAEGSSTALAQAENEYRDFETFFPNMTEASEAQMKIANIHYRQMEKPDRDFTHAKRAEDEYRAMITQYPDSPLIPQAKERLREVQEVLAEREFLIGRFYFLRGSYPASEARLEAVIDKYPLFSGADDTLYMLGQLYEREADLMRAAKLTETQKGVLINKWNNKAAEAYSRIITRYPVTPRASDAKERLTALKRPIPTPTPEAIAQNKKEEEGREELSRKSKFFLLLHKRPDLSQTAKAGDPTLVDPKDTSAPLLVTEQNIDIMAAIKNQPLPSEVKAEEAKRPPASTAGDNPPPTPEAPKGIGELSTIPDADAASKSNVEARPGGRATPGANQPPPSTQSPKTDQPPQAPAQVNEAAPSTSTDTKASGQSSTAQPNDNSQSSSSKTKKKKGLRKIVPF